MYFNIMEMPVIVCCWCNREAVELNYDACDLSIDHDEAAELVSVR